MSSAAWDARCSEKGVDVATILTEHGAMGGPGARWAPSTYREGGIHQPPPPPTGSPPPPSSRGLSSRNMSSTGFEEGSKSMSGLLPGPPSTNKGASESLSPGGYNRNLVRGVGLSGLRSSNSNNSSNNNNNNSSAVGGFATTSGTWVERGNVGYNSACAAVAARSYPVGPSPAPPGQEDMPPQLRTLLAGLSTQLVSKGPRASFRLFSGCHRACASVGFGCVCVCVSLRASKVNKHYLLPARARAREKRAPPLSFTHTLLTRRSHTPPL